METVTVVAPGAVHIITPAGGADADVARVLAGELDGWQGLTVKALSDGRIAIAASEK